jgi:hypothetical protein
MVVTSSSSTPKPVVQTTVQQSNRSAFPTMHDLPSENPLESGLPDEFHGLQPQLLADTVHLRDYDKSKIFHSFDLNLYYDLEHPGWYKRPDWFLVVGTDRLYRGQSSRSSYVIWDEQRVVTRNRPLLRRIPRSGFQNFRLAWGCGRDLIGTYDGDGFVGVMLKEIG